MPTSASPYLYPHPTKPGVFVSRQRVWQVRKQAAGVCRSCGQPRVKGSALYCRVHQLQNAAKCQRYRQRVRAR